jgi:hypothetical protein
MTIKAIESNGFVLTTHRRNVTGFAGAAQRTSIYFRHANDNSKCKQEIWITPSGRILRLIYGYNKVEAAQFVADHTDELNARLSAVGMTLMEAANGVKMDSQANHTIALDDVLKLFDWLDDAVMIEATATRRRTEDAQYFVKAAATIIHSVKIDFMDVVNRGNLGFDQHDNLITIGKSVQAELNSDEPTWREHLVPCTLILDEAVKMAQAGATVTRIAQMLKQNLVIVVITQKEQEGLDAKYRTTMPAGWKFGDSVFARLDEVGIVY